MSKLLQPFIDKYQSWNRKRKYKENDYYRIATEVNSGIVPIELLKGPFKGIIYSYGQINIDEDLGHMGAKATFDVDIIKGPQNIIEDPKFSKLIGDILLVIMDLAVKAQADKFISENLADEEIGESYIEEPIPRRTVREKDSAVSKKRVSTGKKRKKSVRGSTKVRSTIQSDTEL